MNEYKVITKSGIYLTWFGNSVKSVKQEAENSGHKVKSVQFVKKLR